MLRKGLRPDVMLYLARAHYDADKMLEARDTLIRAIHLWPNDFRLRFNLGVTLQVSRPGSARGTLLPLSRYPFPSQSTQRLKCKCCTLHDTLHNSPLPCTACDGLHAAVPSPHAPSE